MAKTPYRTLLAVSASCWGGQHFVEEATRGLASATHLSILRTTESLAYSQTETTHNHSPSTETVKSGEETCRTEQQETEEADLCPRRVVCRSDPI